MAKKFVGTPCIQSGCKLVSTKGSRCEQHQLKPFKGNYRKSRLPKDWAYRKAAVLKRDSNVCYLCGEPGADGVDHLTPNDNHDLTNLKAVHQIVRNSEGIQCHRSKTAYEGVEARKAMKPAAWGTAYEERIFRKLKGEEG